MCCTRTHASLSAAAGVWLQFTAEVERSLLSLMLLLLLLREQRIFQIGTGTAVATRCCHHEEDLNPSIERCTFHQQQQQPLSLRRGIKPFHRRLSKRQQCCMRCMQILQKWFHVDGSSAFSLLYAYLFRGARGGIIRLNHTHLYHDTYVPDLHTNPGKSQA